MKECQSRYGNAYSHQRNTGSEIDENYIDMSSTNGSACRVQIVSSEKGIYDKVKEVRPIYRNYPVNNEPMEIVPMIHL